MCTLFEEMYFFNSLNFSVSLLSVQKIDFFIHFPFMWFRRFEISRAEMCKNWRKCAISVTEVFQK